jgi:hypothetical protein
MMLLTKTTSYSFYDFLLFIKFTILHSKNDTMPNKKYKIAVIQLNLNDVAENNLKMFELGA